MHFANEVLDHFLGDFEIRNDTIAHRADRLHIQRCLAKHFFGVITNRIDHLAAALVHVGNHRGFIEFDALTFDIDQRVRCSEVDGHVCGKNSE